MSKRSISYRGRRRRYSQEERKRLVAEYRESGLTQEAFAEERGINVGTFRQWLYRRDRTPVAKGNQAGGFAEIALDGFSPWTAEIDLPQGARLRLSAHASPRWAGELIKTLQAI